MRKKYLPVSRILGIRFLYGALILPKSQSEDDRRKERILNIILSGTLALLMLLGISIVISYIHPHGTYSGVPPVIFALIIGFFAALLYLSRKGFPEISSSLLVGAYFGITVACVYHWSFVLPMIILGSVLTIVISSILFSTRFSFVLTAVLAACVSTITLLQTHGVIPLDLYWQHDPVSVQDVLEMCAIFFFISGISWLSNRETEISLARARASENELILERNALESKVEERTRELKDLQLAQISKLSQLAEFGSLSSGIFHDLMNPLNSVVANIDRISEDQKNLHEAKDFLGKAVVASRRMGDYLNLIGKQIKPSDARVDFSPAKEIRDAIDILSYKARMAQVGCDFVAHGEILLFGNPLQFHRAALNLISNAIDSYRDKGLERQRRISISLTKQDNTLVLGVEDSGTGILPEDEKFVFEPFFTTKKSHGIGMGLSGTKAIIEKEFGGTISFKSTPKEGTVFSVTIPLS